jgi:hypothetical protein
MAEQSTPPVCIRCGANDVEAMLITEGAVFWYCRKCGQIWGVPQLSGPEAATRLEQLQHLLVESWCLADLARGLLQDRGFRWRPSNTEIREHCRMMRGYNQRVRSHVAAVRAALHTQPDDITVSSQLPGSESAA